MNITVNPLEIRKKEINDLEISGKEVRPTFQYGFGLSPRDPKDPESIYFTVFFDDKYELADSGELLILIEALIGFKVPIGNNAPTKELLIRLTEKATEEYNKYYNELVKDTKFEDLEPDTVEYDDVLADLEEAIDIWDRAIRNFSMN